MVVLGTLHPSPCTLVRIHFVIEMVWWTGLAPWEFGKGVYVRVTRYSASQLREAASKWLVGSSRRRRSHFCVTAVAMASFMRHPAETTLELGHRFAFLFICAFFAVEWVTADVEMWSG